MPANVKTSLLALGLATLVPSLFALSGPLSLKNRTSDVPASDSSNPYAVIVDRNIFRLNPIPPPPAPEQKPAVLPKVYLNGIIKIGDDIRVLFSIPAKDNKGQPAYYKLATGEKDRDLELVNIHPDQAGVDVLVAGTAMTLSLASNSMAMLNAPAAAATAASAPPPTGAASSSALVGGGANYSSPYGQVAVAGGRSVSTPSVNNNNNNNNSQGNVAGGGGGYSPSPLVAANNSSAAANSQPQIQIGNPVPDHIGTPEESAANLIIASSKLPNGPPLPPSLQSMVNGGSPPTP